MTVDLILHGVPNGQDIWGVSDDTHYFSTFYAHKDEKELLSIDARKVSGKSYCYYNYLKYNGVTASDGRAGAYIGITIRFDAYYKDIFNIYHLCEIVYNSLLNSILIKNGDNVKFKITKFEDAEQELGDIKKKIFNLINLSATSKDFTPINDSFFTNDNKTVKAFLLDCTPDNVLQALLKYGKVEISKYYPSINETKKLKNIEERYIATISQKDKELQSSSKQTEDLRLEQSRLQNELESKNGRINELNKLISEKDNTIKSNEEALKEVNSYIDKCKELQVELDRAKSEIRQLNNIVSEKDDIIKRNDHTVAEANQLKRHIQELNSLLRKQKQEIEDIKAELIEYKGNHQSHVAEDNHKTHSHRKKSRVKGRQYSSYPSGNNDYYMENHYDYGSETTSFREKISRFKELPLWQLIAMAITILALLSFAAFGLVKCSSNDEEARVEKTTQVRYIEDINDEVDDEQEDFNVEVDDEREDY